MSSCLFCDIIEGRAKGNIVHQDGSLVAFKDINPKAPVHLLIVPRKHIASLLDLQQDDRELIGGVLTVASKLARDNGVAEEGFRVVVNSGPNAGQSVFHIHFHLLGGRRLGWPPG
ncbi:MAG: histidine triad nucleotide-binding protein [Deltaproteobacteria bacterium]|nr:histidine triad nucleotide-binding protein [Deltaproteobacteria bacterium]